VAEALYKAGDARREARFQGEEYPSGMRQGFALEGEEASRLRAAGGDGRRPFAADSSHDISGEACCIGAARRSLGKAGAPAPVRVGAARLVAQFLRGALEQGKRARERVHRPARSGG
jgi:hypothetical protein